MLFRGSSLTGLIDATIERFSSSSLVIGTITADACARHLPGARCPILTDYKRRETECFEKDGNWILRETGSDYGMKSGTQDEPITYPRSTFSGQWIDPKLHTPDTIHVLLLDRQLFKLARTIARCPFDASEENDLEPRIVERPGVVAGNTDKDAA